MEDGLLTTAGNLKTCGADHTVTNDPEETALLDATGGQRKRVVEFLVAAGTIPSGNMDMLRLILPVLDITGYEENRTLLQEHVQ